MLGEPIEIRSLENLPLEHSPTAREVGFSVTRRLDPWGKQALRDPPSASINEKLRWQERTDKRSSFESTRIRRIWRRMLPLIPESMAAAHRGAQWANGGAAGTIRKRACLETPRMPLANSDLPSHAINQLLGIVADSGFKHRLHVFDLLNSF
jgi:hypothetical protein